MSNMAETSALPDAPAKPPGANRFAYASGAKPLAGYTIKRGVGHGGFGEVYYAVSDAGKEVALKLIRRNLDIEQRGVRQCLNLKHPNLISLFDLKEDEQGQTWVIMEYVAGPSLEETLAAHPQGLPTDEALDWFRGVAAAVAHLHDQGLVHRDLKPANIFRDLTSSDAQGHRLIKLGDYGLSKFISVSRRSGQTESVGTVHYMAPEIANGRYGKSIDIYALGIMLYELLTGHVPFEGESVGEVLMKHMTAEPDLSRLAPNYRRVVQACLAKDPAVRPQSVPELLAMLPAADGTPAVMPAAAAKATSASDSDPTDSTQNDWVASVNESFENVRRWWHRASVPTRVAGVIALILVARITLPLASSSLGLIAAGGSLMEVLIMLAVGFAVVKYVKTHSPRRAAAGMPPPNAAPRPPVTPAPRPTPQPAAASRDVPPPLPTTAYGHRWGRRAVEALTVKSRGLKARELTGAWLVSALVVLITTPNLIVVLGAMPRIEQLVWLLLTSLSGAWLVLAVAKPWEGTHGEPLLRRLVLMSTGLLWGLVAWGLAQYLSVELPFKYDKLRSFALFDHSQFYLANGQPELLCYLAYFGFLAAAVRWWQQVTPLRRSRVSLMALAGAVFAAWALNLVCNFPQPWGLLVAGAVSLAVQIAAPWQIPLGERSRRGD
ncbi:MAG: serine/threonine protein kinase [Planctomycetes bacterium]|nr:serine/threonine protein kinase [Planctomycetota bacterium]